METALALAGAVALVAVILAGIFAVDALRLRRKVPAWRALARDLGGFLTTSHSALTISASIGGRPVELVAQSELVGSAASGQQTGKLLTTIRTFARHLDDVAHDVPSPPPERDAWLAAWRDADARATSADLPRAVLPEGAVVQVRASGVLGDELGACVAELVARVADRERVVAAWTATARALDLGVRGAYLLEGELRGCAVRVNGDPETPATVVRATGVARGSRDVVYLARTPEPPGGYDELVRADLGAPEPYVAHAADAAAATARFTPAAGAALRRCEASSVMAEQTHATVILEGLEPDLERWRAAIALAVELVAAPGDGAFRS